MGLKAESESTHMNDEKIFIESLSYHDDIFIII